MKKYILVIILFLALTPVIMAIEFSEDWESGDLSTNGWTFEPSAGNWEIWEFFGNPGTSVRITGFPAMQNYDYRLVSQELDGNGADDIYFSYDVFGRLMRPGSEILNVEVRISGEDWQTIATYNSDTPGNDSAWVNEQFEISELVAGNTFQIAFRAHGTNSMDLLRWHIDNIHLFESIPIELPFLETWNSGGFSTNNWSFEPEQGSWNITQYNENNVAEFLFDMYTDYSFALTSQPFDAMGCSIVELTYDVALYNFDSTGLENMTVEVNSGDDWEEVASYDNSGDNFQLTETFDISEYVAGNVFQLRFRANGADAFNIDSWTIDNIIITDGTPMSPPHLYGHVIDAETQEAVTDAAVQISDLVQITYLEEGLEGSYGYDIAELESGTHLISCCAPGYSTIEETINLQLGEELEYNIMLQPNHPDQVPEGLQVQPTGLDEVELSWQPLEIDEFLEEGYDDGQADSMTGYDSGDNQLIGNRFEFTEQINLFNACYYIEFGNTVPGGDEPHVRFYILGESNGQPDMNIQLCEPIELDNLIHENPVPALWLQIPCERIIPAETPFYLCMEWEQINQASEFMSLGADLNEPQDNSWISSDAGMSWQQMTGGSAMNAMIRCHYLPQIETDQILLGYNVYRDGNMINQETLTATAYTDSGLAQGEYSYRISALYNNIESGLSEPVTVTAGQLPAPHFINATLNLWDEPYISVNWNCQTYPGLNLLGYNIYRNGELLNNDLLPLMPMFYEDHDFSNGDLYTYQTTAVYEEGESDFSPVVELNVLMPPQNYYGIPWSEYVELGWEAPVEPVAGVDVLGYNIYNFGMQINTELITETHYEDTEFMEQNEYFFTAVYSSGESQLSSSISVCTGEEVILPPENLSAEIENSDVTLNWERPDDSVTWYGWDANAVGESFGMTDNSEFTALVEFDEWDLLNFENNTAIQIAFFPTANADYTIQIYSNDFMNPENYALMEEIPVNEYILNDWNTVNISDLTIVQTFTRIRIGIVCYNYSEAPLACDEGPNETDKADYVITGEEWQNLSEDYDLNANWKIRIMMEEQESGGPVRERNSSYLLQTYKLYRNNEEITELQNIWEMFVDHDLQPGDYTYSITGIYNVMGAVLVESEAGQPVTITIEEPVFPPPSNLLINITDYNTAHLTWNEPNSWIGNSNAKITPELITRERELLGYYIYRDMEPVNSEPLTETNYNDSLLAAGQYDYQVTAVYDQGSSEPTPVQTAEIILPAPIDLAAEYNEGNVILSWTTSQPEWTLDSFNIFRDNELIADEITTLDYLDNDLAAGEYSYQIQAVFMGDYTSELSDPCSIAVTPADNSLLPQVTELQGNYPNPFNPETCIRFTLANEAFVTLKIYNIKGELVRSLIDGTLPAGYQQINWTGIDNQGRSTASGVYLYSLTAGNYHALRKMSLLK